MQIILRLRWSSEADMTQPSLKENEQQAHTGLRWEHTQNSISNQPKAQAGHTVTHTPTLPTEPGKAPGPSTGTAADKQMPTTTNKVSSWGTLTLHGKKYFKKREQSYLKLREHILQDYKPIQM